MCGTKLGFKKWAIPTTICKIVSCDQALSAGLSPDRSLASGVNYSFRPGDSFAAEHSGVEFHWRLDKGDAAQRLRCSKGALSCTKLSSALTVRVPRT